MSLIAPVVGDWRVVVAASAIAGLVSAQIHPKIKASRSRK
jgi:hypothetical protein